MKRFVSFLAVALLVVACTVEPEKIHYGTDACYTCKMTLMDKKFGAELVTEKGKIYKFDDVNCMMKFYNEAQDPSQFKFKLVVDFSQPEKLIPANDAFYLKSADIKSPMASQIAAFEKKENLEALQKELNGIYLVWGELVTQFK